MPLATPRWLFTAQGRSLLGNHRVARGVGSGEMGLRRFALGIVSIAAVALVAALPAAGKEGVKATLTTRMPLDAPAGTQLKVAWTLAYLDENGQRQPFGAGAVFAQLRGASGASAETGFASIGASLTGEYAATVVVPKGGIGDVEIGLRGWTSGATGTRRSDVLFPFTNDPVAGSARGASPASGRPGSEHTGTATTWVFALVAAVLSTLAVLAVTLVRRKDAASRVQSTTDRRASGGDIPSARSRVWRR